MRYSSILLEGQRRLAVQQEPGTLAVFARGVELQDVITDTELLPVDTVAATGCAFQAPLRPGKIIGVGLNYQDTITEMGLPAPEHPFLFAKFPSSITGPTSPIEFDPTVTQRVDWEVELAVVMGRSGSEQDPKDALGAVFGYTVANDVSARDLQAADGQWTRGKSLDTFCPIGPAVVTKDELPDVGGLHLRTWVNGELLQQGSTSDLVFGVSELVAYCAQHFSLDPGDLILTGTPSGCGEFRTPPRHLKPGDVLVSEVSGIGRLVNPVRNRTITSAAANDAALP